MSIELSSKIKIELLYINNNLRFKKPNGEFKVIILSDGSYSINYYENDKLIKVMIDMITESECKAALIAIYSFIQII